MGIIASIAVRKASARAVIHAQQAQLPRGVALQAITVPMPQRLHNSVRLEIIALPGPQPQHRASRGTTAKTPPRGLHAWQAITAHQLG